jgi:LCP family protein required for cell wall assembly
MPKMKSAQPVPVIVHEEPPVTAGPSTTTSPESTSEPSRSRFDHRLWVIPLILLVCVGLLAYAAWGKQFLNPGSDSVIGQLGALVTKQSDPVRGEQKDRVNILLLGIGGEGHDGGTLTDSIMVASIKPSTKQVALLSLPRDLIVKIYSESDPTYWEGRKINVAYELGGMETAVKSVETVTGLTMQYYVLVDFSGFRDLIDDVNGVDVTVDHDFVGFYGAQEMTTPCPRSNLYNLEDGAYCAIAFEAGTEHMDGERALIYSRIRKLLSTSPNYSEESSDFARAKRQQNVLQAFKANVLSAGTVLNPTRITSLLGDLDKHMVTNLELWEISRLFELVGDVQQEDIINQVVDDSPGGLVMATRSTETGASIVVPVAGDYDYSEIQALAKHIFKVEPTEQTNDNTNATNINSEATETTTIQIQVLNGTHTAGLASTVAANLELAGYAISNIGNAFTADYTTTTVYPLNETVDSVVATEIADQVGGEVATDRQTETLLSVDDGTLDSSADYIIIVGSHGDVAQTNQE